MAGLGENCCGGGSGFATGDHKVLVDGADTTPDFLSPKLAAGPGITLAVLNPGGDEQVEISATAVTEDHKVLVDGADTTPEFLAAKLAAGAGITLAILNPGANEQVQINATGSALAGVLNVIRYAIGTGATQDSATAIPAAAIIFSAWLDVQTPYTAGATISIGQPGSLTRFQLTTDNNPQAAAIYEKDQDTTSVGLAVVRTTIAGGPVAGAGFVIVKYATPNP